MYVLFFFFWVHAFFVVMCSVREWLGFLDGYSSLIIASDREFLYYVVGVFAFYMLLIRSLLLA